MDKTLSIAGLVKENFQLTADNKKTDLFILSNKNGLEMTITNYGAKIVSLSVKDNKGALIDVVTGHNSIEDYLSSPEPYFGGVCGRTGNRIAKGTFELDGQQYSLAINNGPNNLHGGIKGFNAVVWDARQIDAQTVELTYLSKDGEEGFPGNLHATIIYKLTDNDEVDIQYYATTDKPTIINLTNHSYFNLSGAGDPYIGDHLLQINADTYLPADNTSIPYGKPERVEGTPMDFRQLTEVGSRINEPFEQLIFGKGYDHTYILNKKGSELSYCARVEAPKTGIVMEVYTTEPGVQFYTGNWMTGEFEGKNKQRYPEKSALCLETQHFPDSINHPEYPSVILRPGEKYDTKTIYKFLLKI